MRARELQNHVDELLKRGGLIATAVPRRDPLFLLTNSDICPYFSPVIIRRHGGLEVIGTIGILIKEFEQWWSSLLDRAYPEDEVRDAGLFGLHTGNIEALWTPPTIRGEDDIEDLQAWICTLISTMRLVPTSYHEIEMLNYQPFLGIFTLNRLYGHPVKVYAFKKWSAHVQKGLSDSLTIPLPLPLTSPYERVVDLIPQ
jgi:hypothetical protein